MERRLSPLVDDASAAAGSLRLGLAARGDLRWAVVDLSAPVEAMRRRLDASPTAAVAVGRAMTAATLLLRFSTKVPGRLRLEVRGDGPLGRIRAEIDANGRLVGMVDELRFAGFDDAPHALDIGRAVGKGILRVTQESSARDEPWVSQTALVDGEIGNDLVHYLHQSQQVRSAALLGVLPGPEGIRSAGGLLVEALPGADEASIRQLEAAIVGLDGVGATLEAGGLDALTDAVLGSLDVEELERHSIRYACRCRREALLEQLQGMPEDQIRAIADDD
ncbi:MAG: Hsp33 family molecular chaperone HslO, partial [Acidobacteriota bacterium]